VVQEPYCQYVSPFVLITDSNFDDANVEREILSQAGFDLHVASCETGDDTLAAVDNAEGLLVQFAPVTAAVLDGFPRVRAIVRYGTGLDNVDLAAARERGVAVRGVDGYCVAEVADHAMALLLAIFRGLPQAAESRRAGNWAAPTTLGQLRSLEGASLGLLGFGRIGQAVARRALGFGMNVGAYDPNLSYDQIERLNVEPLDLQDAFRRDVVSLHLPLDEHTAGFVGDELLSLMPAGSVLLNVSRGGLIDEEALLRALDARRPAYAGLDVLTQEPAQGCHPIFSHPRTLVTPHVAFYSERSLLELRRRAAETMVALLSTDGHH